MGALLGVQSPLLQELEALGLPPTAGVPSTWGTLATLQGEAWTRVAVTALAPGLARGGLLDMHAAHLPCSLFRRSGN